MEGQTEMYDADLSYQTTSSCDLHPDTEEKNTTPLLSKKPFLFLVEKNLVEYYSRTHMTETAAISRNTVQEEGCSSISCVMYIYIYVYIYSYQ